MQSSGESEHRDGFQLRESSQWSQVRHLVTKGSANSESGRMRTWACGVSALKRLSDINIDLLATAQRSQSLSMGEFGICRFRNMRLGFAAGSFEKVGASLSFGDLYRIEELSAQGGWIRVSSSTGIEGWVESASHFGLSCGEYKILSSFKRSHRASFLVNALSVYTARN